MVPTPGSYCKDEMKVCVERPGLGQSAVQIGGLGGLLLPPNAASRPEGGPGAKLQGTSWRWQRGGPCGLLRCWNCMEKGLCPQEGEESSHPRQAALSLWALAGEAGGLEEMQTAPSQSPCPLEPETRTLLPKIVHPKCGQPPPSFPRSWE